MASRRQSIPIPDVPNLEFEAELWAAGLRFIAGVDEAGRGALAGPVAAAVAVLPFDLGLCQKLPGVKDSKMMSPLAREFWAEHLQDYVLASAVGFASSQEIDDIGIVPATRTAILRALENLPFSPQHLLVDYLTLPDCAVSQTSLVKGDARSLSIACASVLAKVARDDIMRQLDREYPGYGFAVHKGYGTLAHRRALAQLGHSPIHRRSFQVKQDLEGRPELSSSD